VPAQVTKSPQVLAPRRRRAHRPGVCDRIPQNRLFRALTRLNSGLSAAAVADAYGRLLLVEAPNLMARNRAIHRMLLDGV
jgi:hypothetical protein